MKRFILGMILAATFSAGAVNGLSSIDRTEAMDRAASIDAAVDQAVGY